MKYIASWSGGKDSTAQIIIAHENNEPIDLIIFSEVMFDKNISGELPEHIDFIKNKCIPLFESWGYKVKILHSDLTYMDIFLREPTRGKRFGTGQITGFPMSGRCQVNRSVKVEPITKFLKSYEDEFTQYIGIAIDEPKRLERLEGINRISLLAKYGYTEQDAMDLCIKYGLLSPTYKYSNRGGCWFCPNATKRELRHLRENHKDLWNKLLELETIPNLIGKIWNSLTKTSLHDMETKFFVEDLHMEIEKIAKSDTSVVITDTKTINKHLKTLDNAFDAVRKKYFYMIGFGLYWFDDTGAYQQIEGKAYDTIADFAKDRYGISKATTYQYLAVIKKFGQINPDTGEIDSIQDAYKDYNSTALIVMSGMSDEQLSQCRPDMKIKELKALRDGNTIEDKSKDSTENTNNNNNNNNDTIPPEPKPKPPENRNAQKLFEIKDTEDFEKRSSGIMDAIKKTLSQSNGKQYRVEINMVWD